MRSCTWALGLAALLLTGCAAQQKYHWGSYEGAMYSYYKDPAKASEFAASLQQTIAAAEQAKRIVPPGVYAEYGFLLLQQGKSKESMEYFAKEKATWPESTVLMDTMTKTAGKTANAQASTQ
ncbi:DUF4810 domain-containing protein [Xylophilus sp. ASV27]|uniref:DUF4810 domain-containing protein n=1 Tax=Xylophilus sp. ASV27 TaxID=2795129 RepID=UPI0018EAA886|nr:DUF4810 domain-containing protein [Xylophilus sp. ASV27]